MKAVSNSRGVIAAAMDHLSLRRREQRGVHRIARIRGGRRHAIFRLLCGRATWKDGIPVYAKQGGAAAVRSP
jgi:hypothetical protein